MVPALTEGTSEWFERRLDACKYQAHSLASLHAAASVLTFLRDKSAESPLEVRSSLYLSGVVHYARPFKNNNVEGGQRTYKLSDISSAAGFDREVHDHLVHVRDTLVAHFDSGVLAAAILHYWHDVEYGAGVKVAERCEGYASLSGLLVTLDDAATVARVAAHAIAVRDAAFRKLATALATVHLHALRFPTIARAVHRAPLGREQIEGTVEQREGGVALTVSLPPIAHRTGVRIGSPALPLGATVHSFVQLVCEVHLDDAGKGRAELYSSLVRGGPLDRASIADLGGIAGVEIPPAT